MIGVVRVFILNVYWCLIGLWLTLRDLDVKERYLHWWHGTPHKEELLAESALEACPSKVGYTCIITGSNSGVGLETARYISRKGYRVIMAFRSKARADVAIKDIVDSNKALNLPHNIIYMPLDLASQKSIDFAKQIEQEKNMKLDLLINNAGLMWVDKGKTEEGIELHFGVNHIGHFLLTNLLLPLMHEPSRILILTSETYRLGQFPEDFSHKNYSPFYAYCNSKLATFQHAYLLSDKITKAGKKISVFSINPGTAKTNIIQELPQVLRFLYGLAPRFLLRTSYQAACCSIYAALSPLLEGQSGLYLFESQVKKPDINPNTFNEEQNNKLWTISEQLTNSKFPW